MLTNQCGRNLVKRIWPQVLVYRRAATDKSGPPDRTIALTKNVLSDLASKYDWVSFDVQALTPALREELAPDCGERLLTVKVSSLEDVRNKHKLLINAIDESTYPPIFQLTSAKSPAPSRNFAKYGINLAEHQRGKLLQLNSTIDDNMLGVRLKQVEDFVRDNFVTIVVVKLINVKKSSTSAEDADSNAIIRQQTKERFLAAFKTIPQTVIKVSEKPDGKYETLVFQIKSASSVN